MSVRPWAFQQGVLWAIELARAPLAPPAAAASAPAASFAEAGPDAIAELANAMELRDPDEVARRFATGRRCFAGRKDGALVTYAWLSLRHEDVGELERAYRLPPGEAYIWDCATLPAHRGGGLYSALLCAVVAALCAEGQRRAWIGANLENEPSLRAFARAGFQPVVRAAYARLLRLRCMRLWAQPGATGALVESARAMLTEPYERAWRGVIFGLQPGGG